MTFTYPKNPPEGAGESGIEDMPLVAFSMPEDGTEDVGRLNSINVKTTLPIMEPFQYDDGNWYILCVGDSNELPLGEIGENVLSVSRTDQVQH